MGRRENPADLVMLGDEILYSPTGVLAGLQCVARTAKGRRCRNVVEAGQITNWSTLRSTSGVIVVYELSWLADAERRRWLEQHCVVHDVPAAIDFESPEWEKFDPEGVHAHMVRSLDALAENATRQIRDGVTEDWRTWDAPRGW